MSGWVRGRGNAVEGVERERKRHNENERGRENEGEWERQAASGTDAATRDL